MVLGIDGSLRQIHSENKEHAAANYKGGYGFHPIYCFARTPASTRLSAGWPSMTEPGSRRFAKTATSAPAARWPR